METIRDISYSIEQNELYVLTENNVWIYSFDIGGWIGNYHISDAEHIQYVRRYDAIVVFTGDEYLFLIDSDDDYDDAEVELQPLVESAVNVRVREFLCDYKPVHKTGQGEIEQDDDMIVLTDGSFDESDQGAMLRIKGGAGGGRDLTSVIREVVDSTTAVIASPAKVSGDVSVVWFPTAKVAHVTKSDYHSDRENTYRVYPKRRMFPRVNGSGHQFSITGFCDLREILYTIERI